MNRFPRCLVRAALPAALPLLAAFSLAAQSPSTLVGLTGASTLLVRQDPATCAATSCTTSGHAFVDPAAGGTAFDSLRQGVWISAGKALSLVDPNTCASLCAPQQIDQLGMLGLVSGLAHHAPSDTLLIATTANLLYTARPSCPLVVTGKCDLTPNIFAGATVGGLATDDANGIVFFSASNFATPATPNNVIYSARIGSPCLQFCKQADFSSCGGKALGPITGLAFDSCDASRRFPYLWLTDGTRLAGWAVSNPTGCGFNQERCCSLSLGGEAYVGLCVLPSLPVGVGKSCTGRPCADCPGMVQTLRNGVPTLGNASFTLDLENAPSGAAATFFLGIGACSVGGVAVGLCDTVRVSLVAPGPIVIGVGSTGGAGACGGRASLPLPIANDRALNGLVLSSQAAVVCPASPTPGAGLTGCLSWRITGGY